MGEIMMYKTTGHSEQGQGICIAGTGNTTGVLVPLLTTLDYRATILTRTAQKAEQLKGVKFVLNNITSRETYHGEPFLVTTDAKTALQDSSVVVLAIPMSGWETYLLKNTTSCTIRQHNCCNRSLPPSKKSKASLL